MKGMLSFTMMTCGFFSFRFVCYLFFLRKLSVLKVLCNFIIYKMLGSKPFDFLVIVY